MRQRPNRYAFRAGRNLPDKEFRYLRTVIVTAAVYWGFDSKLLQHSIRSTNAFYPSVLLSAYFSILSSDRVN